MIDFRYHLVSIVAVFLALAVGIVVGATALKPKTLQGLDSLSRREQHQINAQQTLITGLEHQVSSDEAAAKAAAPLVLNNLLAGQRVVLVTAPNSDPTTISGVTTALQQAGAKVTGQAELQPAFFDTSASTEKNLETLAQHVAPPGVTPGIQSGQPDGNTQIAGQQEAAQVLAAALVTKVGDLPAQQAKPIIDGFAAQRFLQMSFAGGSAVPSQATLAVVIIPASPPASASDPLNLALISLAAQLKASSHGVVLAGSILGSGPGSAVDELINGSTGVQLSSVNNADTEVGQIFVAQALNYALIGHKAAAYGVPPGAAPSPAPTPTATPTPTRPPAKNKSGG